MKKGLFEQALTPGLSLFGQFEYGSVMRQGEADGLVSDLSGLSFSGIEIGASLADTLSAGDRLTFSMSQPLRIETGTITVERPVARRADGSILNESSSDALSPSGRQVDLGLSYEARLPNAASFRLGLKRAVDAGHVTGQSSSGFMMGYQQRF